MDKFIQYIISPFVEDFDLVDIKKNEQENQTEIVVTAPSEYMGLLIGKQGRTVASLRQLCRLYGNIHQSNILFRIEEKAA